MKIFNTMTSDQKSIDQSNLKDIHKRLLKGKANLTFGLYSQYLNISKPSDNECEKWKIKGNKITSVYPHELYEVTDEEVITPRGKHIMKKNYNRVVEKLCV